MTIIIIIIIIIQLFILMGWHNNYKANYRDITAT